MRFSRRLGLAIAALAVALVGEPADARVRPVDHARKVTQHTRHGAKGKPKARVRSGTGKVREKVVPRARHPAFVREDGAGAGDPTGRSRILGPPD